MRDKFYQGFGLAAGFVRSDMAPRRRTFMNRMNLYFEDTGTKKIFHNEDTKQNLIAKSWAVEIVCTTTICS